MAKHRPQLIEYLGNECAHCSKSVEEMVARYGTVHRVFKFHHVVPEEKAGDYDNLIRRNISKDQLDEIDKCILLCGDCHDILHAQGINGHLNFRIELGDRSAEQTIRGNFVVDAVDKVMTFMTNERVYVNPYFLKLGDLEPELVFGTELNDGLMIEKLSTLRDNGVLKLYSFPDGEWVFQATLTERDSVMFQYNIAMNLPFNIDPANDNNEPEKGWVRNGVALLTDGRTLTSGTIGIDITQPTFL